MTTPRPKSDYGYFPEYSGLDIASLRDVDLLGLADGNVLVWNESRELWDVGAVAGANELTDLSDVTLTAPALNEVLTYNGAIWVNQAPGAVPLNSLTDVTLTAPALNQVLTFNGTVWVNQTLPTDSLSGLSDTDINTPALNEVLVYDGANWANVDSVTLTDVTASGTVTGATLTDNTIIMTGGVVTGVTSITASTVAATNVNASTVSATTLTDGTINITGGDIFNVGSITADEVVVNKGNVTQLTSVTTPVTVNAGAGIITTMPQSAVPSASIRFTVNNSSVQATSAVIAQISGYASGSTGIPVIYVDDVQAGSFDIVVSNVHSTADLNAVLEIAFVIH